MVSDMLVGTSGKECMGINGAATGPGAEQGGGGAEGSQRGLRWRDSIEEAAGALRP